MKTSVRIISTRNTIDILLINSSIGEALVIVNLFALVAVAPE